MSIFNNDKSSSESGHINVVAKIVAKAGHEGEVRSLLELLVVPARAEDGCKGYHLHVDKKNPGTFYTYEEWTSEAKLDKHLEGLKDRIGKAMPLLASAPEINVLEHLV